METEGVRRRWLVDISRWNPSENRFGEALSVLPIHEQSVVTRFIKFEDRKRALVSRLLQYVLVRDVLQISVDKIIIKRTREGKPYVEDNGENSTYPNFNFSVSHHGDYVGIASDLESVVGFDIVSIDIPKQATSHDFINSFSSYFTSLEWQDIYDSGNSNEILTKFYRYWCLKESYVKALGTGLGYGLHRLEFHHTGWSNISLYVDGLKSRNWRFCLFELDNMHLASIAQGQPQEIYSEKQELSTDFQLRTVEQLVGELLQ